MATGIQTGMRTGAAPTQTPRNNSPFAKLLQSWNSLAPKQKMTYFIVVAGFILLIVAGNYLGKASAYVELYPNLSASDAQAVMMRLSEWKVDYQSDGTKVMVPPAQKAKLQIQLQAYGIPHKAVYVSPTDEGGLSPKTQDEKDYQRLQQLQADLVDAIRQVDGVADANVKITLPRESQFLTGGTKAATAAVMIRMQPSAKLNEKQVSGIINFVAYSVPELTPENVKVMDTRGIVLNDHPTIAGPEGITNLSNEALQTRMSYENELKNRVQAQLDQILGPGKAVVSVSATIDFSNQATEATTVEPGTVISTQKSKEIYKQGGKDGGADQMALNPGASPSGGKMDYGKENTTEIKKAGTRTVKRVTPGGTVVSRLTASVALDSSVGNQAGAVEKIVKDTLGYDSTRGDSVSVATLPFGTNLVTQMASEMAAGAGDYSRPRATGTPSNLPIMISLVPMAALLIILVLFTMKQKQAQAEKAKLILSTGPNVAVNDISDLLSDKIGKSTSPPATRVNTTEQLEKLAKEKPTKVAELLKSTWLAEKER